MHPARCVTEPALCDVRLRLRNGIAVRMAWPQNVAADRGFTLFCVFLDNLLLWSL
jgi:hypothetical protein